MSFLGARVWLPLLALGLSLGLTLWPRPAVYHLRIELEEVNLRLLGPRVSWRFKDAQMTMGFPAQPGSSIELDGEVEPQTGVDLKLGRSGLGPVLIRLAARSAGSPVAVVHRDGTISQRVRGRLSVRLKETPTRVTERGSLVFPIAGIGRLGAEIGVDNRFGSPLLRSGQVVVVEQAWLGGAPYVAGSLDLSPGDVVKTDGDEPFIGAIIIDEKPAMKAVFDIRAPRLTVLRAGAGTLHLSSYWLAKLRHDPSIQLAWGTTLFVLGLQSKLWRRSDEEKRQEKKLSRGRPRYRPSELPGLRRRRPSHPGRDRKPAG